MSASRPVPQLLRADGVPVRDGAMRQTFSLSGCTRRLVELCAQGSARAGLSAAFELVAEAQSLGEPVAWLGVKESSFFPPDAAAHGIALEALVVVRVPEPAQVARAADTLARSGAFGLLILDLAGTAPLAGALARRSRALALPLPMQARLLGLAQKHDLAIVCLCEAAGAVSAGGSLVSLRLEVAARALGAGQFVRRVHAIKDKLGAPGWLDEAPYHGPPGLW